jgi:hypothetical protein
MSPIEFFLNSVLETTISVFWLLVPLVVATGETPWCMVNIFAKKGIHMYNRNKLYPMSVLTLGTYSYIHRKRILAFCPEKCRSRRPKMGTALQDLCQLQGCQIFLGT